MRYFIVAGEMSGDNLGGGLINELSHFDNNAKYQFWGGDEMQEAAGIPPLKHCKELAFMGLVEVMANLPSILSNFGLIKSQINLFKPDTVILIDYPGFNLRLVKWLKSQKYKVIYYVSPTVWAWHSSRVYSIKKYVDLMICILPFEVDFYKKYAVNAIYCGNPSVDKVKSFIPDKNFVAKYHITKPILAIIPGSRVQEINKMLPAMLTAAKEFINDYDICISKTKHLDIEIFEKILTDSNLDYHLIEDDYHNLLSHSRLSIVTSGTASLETALHGVPQVVCYKMNSLNYALAKRIVNVKYISLVNIIADAPLVQELIQENCTSNKIVNELRSLKYKDRSIYSALYDRLGEVGSQQRIAKAIWHLSQSTIE